MNGVTDGNAFKEKKCLSIVAGVLIFSVFVKEARRLAAVTVSCRAHQWRPVLVGERIKEWTGPGL